MSDCESAMAMVERAWKSGRREYAKQGRGAILEAICTQREQIGQAVFMYVPAHRGVWANAMADAAAKAGLGARRSDVSEQIRAGVRWRPFVRVLEERSEDGAVLEEVWDVDTYTATREAMGWYLRTKEYAQLSDRTKRVVEETRLGPAWRPQASTRWQAVWERTGSQAPEDKQATLEEEEGVDEEGSGVGAAERRRVGAAMAARAGQLWELQAANGNKGQGCPACCSHAHGWRWGARPDGGRDWMGPAGQRAVQATPGHVMCGACDERTGERRMRREMRDGLVAVLRATRVRGRKGHKAGDGGAYADTRQLVALAIRETRGEVNVGEALRRVLAGDLPKARDEWRGPKEQKAVAGKVAAAVRQLQSTVAAARERWRKAAATETARRKDAMVGEELRKGVWQQWESVLRHRAQRADKIAQAYRRRTARGANAGHRAGAVGAARHEAAHRRQRRPGGKGDSAR